MKVPDLSIVIPYFNRGDTIGSTLASIEEARGSWDLEVILVDDGSAVPAVDALTTSDLAKVTRMVRQDNQGLLFARLAGLKQATGEYTLFLDSDDLVGPEKFNAQLSAMRSQSADVSYSDVAEVDLSKPAPRPLSSAVQVSTVSDAAEFYLRVQPPPHSPIFRTGYLRRLVDSALFPPDRRYNPVAEIWFYYNASVRPAEIIKVDGYHTLVGRHAGPRITGNWERMGFAAVAVATAFLRTCPHTDVTRAARQLAGECAFHSWRASPYDFAPQFHRRLLAIWRNSPDRRRASGGGRGFRILACILGPVVAGRLLHRIRGHSYESCRTIDATELETLVKDMPIL